MVGQVAFGVARKVLAQIGRCVRAERRKGGGRVHFVLIGALLFDVADFLHTHA